MWALPAIALAVAAPAATASTEPPAVLNGWRLWGDQGTTTFFIQLVSASGEPIEGAMVTVEFQWYGVYWLDPADFTTGPDGHLPELSLSPPQITAVRATTSVGGQTIFGQWAIPKD